MCVTTTVARSRGADAQAERARPGPPAPTARCPSRPGTAAPPGSGSQAVILSWPSHPGVDLEHLVPEWPDTAAGGGAAFCLVHGFYRARPRRTDSHRPVTVSQANPGRRRRASRIAHGGQIPARCGRSPGPAGRATVMAATCFASHAQRAESHTREQNVCDNAQHRVPACRRGPSAARRRFALPGATTTVIIVATLVGLALRLYQLSRPGYLLGITEYDDGTDFGSAVRLIHGALPVPRLHHGAAARDHAADGPGRAGDQGGWAPSRGWRPGGCSPRWPAPPPCRWRACSPATAGCSR